MHNCRYCARECKNLAGLHKHERHCRQNLRRVPQRNPNTYSKLQDLYNGIKDGG